MQIPVVDGSYAGGEVNAWTPTELLDARGIQHLPRRSVGSRSIPLDAPVVLNGACDQVSQFRDRQIFARTHIYHLTARELVHQKDASLGQVIDVQEFAARGA